MDKSDLQTMLQFAAKYNLMHKPLATVKKWYEEANSLNDKSSIIYTLWTTKSH